MNPLIAILNSRMFVSLPPDGYSAVTHYEVVEQFAHAALVRIWLETGRTHQIRVHMRHLGHPLLGDKMYTLPEFEQSLCSELEASERLNRQALACV